MQICNHLKGEKRLVYTIDCFFAMQKHSKTRNVPFPRPCGATGNDAQKLHALTFAHFHGAVLMHEVLYPERSESPVDLPSANGLQIGHKQMGLLEKYVAANQ